ncbi:MAG: sphingomyelin phosphodiesterase [Candidatus Binatia bacterium]
MQPHIAPPQSPVALKVLTYNVQFRPALADMLAPGWPNTQARAEAIGRAIACYDIIALQEVFRADRLAEIVRAAERAGAQCGNRSRLPSGKIFAVATGPRVHPTVNSFPFTIVEWTLKSLYNLVDKWLTNNQQATPVANSGLVLLSRYPIVSVESQAFRSRRGFDAWARKGVLHAVLQVEPEGTGRELDVFITHLQAAHHRHTRLAQVRELARFIGRKRVPPSPNPVLVLGDFNIDGAVRHWQHTQSEYSLLHTTLRNVAPQLVDVWSVEQETTPGFTNARRDRRIDYIFASQGRGLAIRRVRIQEFGTAAAVPPSYDSLPLGQTSPVSPYTTLSDHAGVEAVFRWRP